MSERAVGAGSVVTVGTFDGLHRGHVALLGALRDAADRLDLPAVVVTFEPHPLQVVRPESAPRLLSSHDERVDLFAQLGVDRAVFLKFDAALAALPPERFVREILVDRLDVRHLVTGYDHGFGRDRSGDAELLRASGKRLGFTVEVLPPLEVAGGPASSSRVRRALADGDVALAATLLGRAYAVRGIVARGDGRGRELGFPTANLTVDAPDKLLPAEGIYAARAAVGKALRDGVVHLGPRPTYPGAAPTLELHLFDFAGDLYGHALEIRFCERLRGVERFATEAALVEAIAADVRAARRALGRAPTACGPVGERLD